MRRVLIDATFLDSVAGGVTQNALYLNKLFEENKNYVFFWLVRSNQSWWLGNINQSKIIETGISTNYLTWYYNYLEKINLVKIFILLFRNFERHSIKKANYQDFELFISIHQNPIIEEIDMYFVHDLQHLYFPENFTNKELKEREMRWKTITQESGIVMVESERVKDDLIKLWRIKEDKIVVYDTQVVEIKTNPECRDKIVDLIKLRYMVYPANGWKHKNHKILINAMKLVNSSSPGENLKLVLIGRFSNKLKRWINKNSNFNNVNILDYVSENEKNLIIKNSLFVIIPSLFESKSLVLKEANFFNKFTLVSKTLDTTNCHINSYCLIDPWSEKDIADKILMTCKTILQKSSIIDIEDGRSYVNNDFNIYLVLDELVRIKDNAHG
jgi:glycosyltransferase involved in cell wall biosynthesis